MFLNSGIALGITIDSDCSFFIILFVFIFHIIIDQIQNQFFHIQSVFLLESEYTFVVEQERERSHCTEITAKLIKYRTNVSHRTGCVICQRIHKYSNTVRTVSFVSHALVVALVFTHCVFDSTFNIILRHIFTLTSSDHRTQSRVIFRFRTACLYSYRDLFTQSCKCFSHVAPPFQLCGFSIFKCSSHWFIFLD